MSFRALQLARASVAVLAMSALGAAPGVAQSTDVAVDNERDDTAAASNITVLPPFTVTAARQRRSLVETAGNATSVTSEELERRMDNVLEDVFRYEPGIEVFRQTTGTDPFSSSGGVAIRGVGGNRTQILVDGNRTIESIQDSTRDIVDSANMKAVEIVRGPASVLWGSDGLGGVINFVTKDPSDFLEPGEDFGGEFRIHYGSLDTAFTESLGMGFRVSSMVEAMVIYTRRDAHEIELENARIGADAVQNCTRNAVATPCNKFDPLDSASDNILAKLIWSPSDNNRLGLTAEWFSRETNVRQESTLGPNGATAIITAYDWTQELERWRLSIDHDWSPENLWFDAVHWQATYSPQQSNRNNDRRQTLLPSGDLQQRLQDQDYEETFLEADIQFETSFELGGTDHLITYGFDGDQTETDFSRVDVTRNLTQGTEVIARAGGFNFADATTTRADIYLQDEISLLDGALQLIPGIRIATYEIEPITDADYQLVPGAEPTTIEATDTQLKLGAIYDVTDTYSLYGSISEGFKMPTAQQLFLSLESLPFFVGVPNPNLQPESVDSYEIGLRGDFGDRGYFSVNAFVADYEDFILSFISVDPADFGQDPGVFVFTYDNVDSVHLYGVEASAGFQLTDALSLRGSASYQDGEFEDDSITEIAYLGALPFKVVGGIRHHNENLGVDVELVGTFQAAASEVNNPATQFLPDSFTSFDLLTSWQINDQVTLRANVYNLLDERYFPAETLGFTINGSDAVKRTKIGRASCRERV